MADSMEREILTYPLDRDQIQRELDFVIEHFQQEGIESCKILFGFAWGNEYYPGNHWPYEEIPLESLAEKVREVEANCDGALGQDDLFVEVAGLKFEFCHESDIHIYFEEEPGPEIEFFYSCWKRLGYRPAEWLKNQKIGPGERLRFD